MKSLRLVVFMCLYLLCAPLAAHAERLCPDSAKEWACFGQIEVRLDASKDQRAETTTAKWSFFTNNEETIQLEKDGRNFEQLVIPQKVLLYRGVPKVQNQKEEVDKLVSESSLLIALPIEVLKVVYPSGPQSIGEGTSTISLPKSQDTVTTTRKGPHRIDFQIKTVSGKMSGTWDSQLAEPYPDQLDLRGWSHSGGATINHLSDARLSVPRLRSK